MIYDFFHRAFAAFLAIADRFRADIACALTIPPRKPPALPLMFSGCLFASLTVSSACPVAISTMAFASWFGSRGRFAINSLSHASDRAQDE